MQARWIPTNDIYRELIAAVDLPTRQNLYRHHFIQPWKPMMDMMSGMMQGDPADDFSVARNWAWLLPDQLDHEPDSLRKLEAANAWHIGEQAMNVGLARLEPYADRIPFDEVEGWLMLADPQRSDPIGRGYTGATDWLAPRFVVQVDTLNDYNLPRLGGTIVHEMHHLIRFRIFPFSPMITVGEYIIIEGLAEAFAASLFGDDVVGYYVTEFDESELSTARQLIGAGLDRSGFDVVRPYIFGDYWAEKYNLPRQGVPAYGGYAIGYRVVRAFLKETGTSIEEATFLPAEYIIVGPGYFEG